MTRTFVPTNNQALWRAASDTMSQIPWELNDRIRLTDSDLRYLRDGAEDAITEERKGLLHWLLTINERHREHGDILASATAGTPHPEIVHDSITYSGVTIYTMRPDLTNRQIRDLDSTAYATRFYPYAPQGQWQDGAPSETSDDLVLTPLDGWASNFTQVTPAPELLERLPETIRSAAYRAIPNDAAQPRRVLVVEDDGSVSIRSVPRALDFTGEDLVNAARATWRARLQAKMRAGVIDDGFEKRRAEHRKKTQENWQAFVASRKKETEHLVGTLPFVPHGLASSRRWGIEVESGGARGVECPPKWNVHGDGSLRSAYDGYTEVQDFEPYDEEQPYTVSWVECESGRDHNPRVEIFDATREEYLWVPNENYTDPRECDGCGRRTRTVRIEPQTIRYTAQSGDCREFVSPILTSMHSNGLEALCEGLSKNPQNSSAGVHVHVEADDLTDKQIATLVYGYGLLEPILEASYRRERRDFCQPRPEADILAAGRIGSRGGDFAADGGGRYVTVNTHALSQHGTIEFRAMGPVYEYDYLVRWAMLCRELVNTVAAGASPRDFAKVKSWQDLLNLLAMFGKEYVRASVYEMTGEVGEVAKLEKAGEPVTTEALDADLTTAFEQLNAAWRRLTEPVESMARRLVGVGGTSET